MNEPFSKIQEFYEKESIKIKQWNEKWFAILESQKVTKEQLEELEFNEIVIKNLLIKLPTLEEWEQQYKEDYE